MTGAVVECAAARYQAQSRVGSRAVNGFRRESGFGVLAYAGDAENGGDPVGESHVDIVPGAEGSEPAENGGPVGAGDAPPVHPPPRSRRPPPLLVPFRPPRPRFHT